MVEKETDVNVQLGVGGFTGPVQPNPNVGRVSRRRFEVIRMLTVKGEAYSTKERGETHLLIWEIQENTKQKEGIPTTVRIAAVVQNDSRPFQAAVEIRAWIGAKIRVIGMPWSSADLLVLRPDVTIGSPITGSEFDKFTDAEWKGLIRFSHPFVVSSTRELFNGTFLTLYRLIR